VKKFILLCMLASYSAASFAQPTGKLTKDEYLKRSHGQKIAAFILLGGGATLIAIASPGNASFGTTEALGIAGGLLIIGSIPLFIASGKNRRRSNEASVSFEMNRPDRPFPLAQGLKPMPTLALKINL
jgi:hypothetical protein